MMCNQIRIHQLIMSIGIWHISLSYGRLGFRRNSNQRTPVFRGCGQHVPVSCEHQH